MESKVQHFFQWRRIVLPMWIALRYAWACRTRLWCAPGMPFRGRPALRLDADGGSLCTACGICVDACPTQCIRLVQARLNWYVDLQRCIFCDLCADLCPVDAVEIKSDAAPLEESNRWL